MTSHKHKTLLTKLLD